MEIRKTADANEEGASLTVTRVFTLLAACFGGIVGVLIGSADFSWGTPPTPLLTRVSYGLFLGFWGALLWAFIVNTVCSCVEGMFRWFVTFFSSDPPRQQR
jgi:hypothetical protein